MSRILVSLCLLFAACGEVVPVNEGDGGVDDDAGANDPDATPVDLCAGPEIKAEDVEGCFLKMECQYKARCEAGFPDAPFCEENLFDFELTTSNGATGGGDNDGPSPLMFEMIRRAELEDGLSYNGDKAYECLLSLRDRSCKSEGRNPACEYIVTGVVGEGQVCFDDFQCMEGAKCDRDNGESCSNEGACRMGLAKKADCAGAPDDCQPGLSCVSIVNSRTCEDGKLDSACTENGQCEDGLFCNLGTSKCRDARESGATCGESAECPGDELCVIGKCRSVLLEDNICAGRCFGNLYCAPTSTCKPLPSRGQDCGMVQADQPYRCASVTDICDVQTAPKCIGRIPVGTNCPVGAGNPCALGSFCSSELQAQIPKCTAPGGTGDFCITAKHCASGYCELGATEASNACADFVACWESL